MNMKKRIMALLMAIGIMASITVSASAASMEQQEIHSDAETVVTQEDTPILRGPKPPTDFLNLDSNTYTARVKRLAATKGSYSIYNFSSSNGVIAFDGTVEASGTTNPDSRSFTIDLYEQGTGRWVDSIEFSFSDSADFSDSFTGLSANKTYYFKITNDSNTSTWGSRDLDAELTVSNGE